MTGCSGCRSRSIALAIRCLRLPADALGVLDEALLLVDLAAKLGRSPARSGLAWRHRRRGAAPAGLPRAAPFKACRTPSGLSIHPRCWRSCAMAVLEGAGEVDVLARLQLKWKLGLGVEQQRDDRLLVLQRPDPLALADRGVRHAVLCHHEQHRLGRCGSPRPPACPRPCRHAASACRARRGTAAGPRRGCRRAARRWPWRRPRNS